LGNLATPKSVQKLQTALHAKAKAEAGYRFYALYDKISRDDILVHAYAQCRSNKGAPGIDGQDFAGIEAYGVERWLAELALALGQETYRPEPIRRVLIPKANGKLRPLGISSVRDRVCMTATLLVLEPIFEGRSIAASNAIPRGPPQARPRNIDHDPRSCRVEKRRNCEAGPVVLFSTHKLGPRT
jgi:RNA-directed DNA polymerase